MTIKEKIIYLLDDEKYNIDRINKYQYILKIDSLGFLSCYIDILIEKENKDINNETKKEIKKEILNSILSEFKDSISFSFPDRLLLLEKNKEPNFMLGFNSCLSKKAFILSCNEIFPYWKHYLKIF